MGGKEKVSLFSCWNTLFPKRISKQVEQRGNQHGLWHKCWAVLEAETKQSRKNNYEHSIFTLLCTPHCLRLVIYLREDRMELTGTKHKVEAILLCLNNSLLFTEWQLRKILTVKDSDEHFLIHWFSVYSLPCFFTEYKDHLLLHWVVKKTLHFHI